MRWAILVCLMSLMGCATEEQPAPRARESQQPKEQRAALDAAEGESTKPFLGLADDEERKIEDG